ncbi:hypothetical protein [Microvirga sp. P5_D2]
MNGIELVRRLNERHLSYPVLLITSGTAYDLLERAAGSGIREVLEKPLRFRRKPFVSEFQLLLSRFSYGG